MKKKLFGLMLLVCMIVTSIPTMFYAAETRTKTVKVIAYAEDAVNDTTPLDGVKITLALCNEKTGTGTLITESMTTGANSSAITYNDEGKFEYDGGEYTYFRVTVYANLEGYKVQSNKLHCYTVDEFDAIRDENNVVTLKFMIEKEPVIEDVPRLVTEDCYVGARYEDGVYQYSEVYYEAGANYSDDMLKEALAALTEEDTNVGVYITFTGDKFPVVDTSVMTVLKNLGAELRIFNADTEEYLYWDVVESADAIILTEAENTSVSAKLEEEEIPYILLDVQNINGSEYFVAYLNITPNVLAKGEVNETDEETYWFYEDEKHVYFYDAEKECFVLTADDVFFEGLQDLECPEDEFTVIEVEGTAFPSSGYYVIVDDVLPESLTTPKVEEQDPTPEKPTPETPAPEPEKEVTISKPIADSKEVIELEAEAGVVPTGAQLSVEKISEGETYTKAETALESIVTEKTEVHLFDITLLDSENVKIQPDGKVTITIALEEKLEATEKVTVYRIEDDGTKTLMEGAKVVDGKVVFTTDHFSTYAVLVGEIVTVPKTGDTTTAGIYMMLFIAGAALVLVNKKQFVK